MEFLLGVTLLKMGVSCPRLHFLLQGATCTQPFSKLPLGRLRPLTVYPLHLLSPASIILLRGLLLRIFSREPQSPSLGKSDCRPKLYKKISFLPLWSPHSSGETQYMHMKKIRHFRLSPDLRRGLWSLCKTQLMPLPAPHILCWSRGAGRSGHHSVEV